MSITEACNERTVNIDRLRIKDIVSLLNEEYKTVPAALSHMHGLVEMAAEKIKTTLKNKSKVYFAGAGTSGRLAMMQEDEYHKLNERNVSGLIAGGPDAFYMAVEGAEDKDADVRINRDDVAVALSACGNTPYTISFLKKAKDACAWSCLISCNPESKAKMENLANLYLTPIVGPEPIRGSTRMKSASAQQVVLNLIREYYLDSTVLLKDNFDGLMKDITDVADLIKQQKDAIATAVGLMMKTRDTIAITGYNRYGILQAAECPPTFGSSNEKIVSYIESQNRFFKINSGSTFILITFDDVPAVHRKSYDAIINPMLKKNNVVRDYALKEILDILTTTMFVKLGHVDGNRMTCLQPNSEKLKSRQVNNLMEMTGITHEEAKRILDEVGYNLEEAIVKVRDEKDSAV